MAENGGRPCPACGEQAPPATNWCEACGHDLDAAPTVPCVDCGGQDISTDGYCMACGRRQPRARDRMELVDRSVVAVSDRGKRHHHNEDAVAIAALEPDGAIVVVCDGVSSTPGSAEASLNAAEAARDVLVERLAGLGDDGGSQVEAALAAATAAAQARAASTPDGFTAGEGGPPSSTFVAAVARPVTDEIELGVAWVGDSRAYWIADEPVQLTVDHTIDGSLTRWLGADAIDPTPQIVIERRGEDGTLVVCSDGLWRYADGPDQLAGLVASASPDRVAVDLVEHANRAGGHDNITVAVWPHPAPLDRNEQTEHDAPAHDGAQTDRAVDP